MSLNGLDDARVSEAYHGALAEAGGWFLLKYASRDAVDVFTRGTGGAAEARGAVAQYEDKSPLYGFLLYRRRKVIIKYVPEGTSRLLQARVAVHFTAVTDKFTPHDTTISISSPDELSDAALISACSLHTAAPSSCSSSGSSRRNKLDEITEDVEESQGPADHVAPTQYPATAASSIPTIVEPPAMESPHVTTAQKEQEPEPVPLPLPLPLPQPTSSLDPPKDVDDARPPTSTAPVETPAEEETVESKPSNFRDSLKHYDALFEHGPDPRMSSQTARPAMADLYADIYEKYKPKVKLGPRPRPSMDTKRPHTSGNGAQGPARPVSTLPAGMRAANRKTMEPKRPKSRDSSVVPAIAFPPPPPVPAIPDMALGSLNHPPKSPASVRSMPMPSYSLSHRAPAVTPEKQRLMKALELRKKQIKARKEKDQRHVSAVVDDVTTGAEGESAANPSQPTDFRASAAAFVKEDKEETGSVTTSQEAVTAPAQLKEHVLATNTDTSALDHTQSALTPADSAVEMVTNQVETDDQQSAASASSPTSAQTQGSSCAPSTRPSSISEDDNLINESKAAEIQGHEQPLETSANEDEKGSVESSPTVVPESDTPVSTSTNPPTSATPTPSSEESARRRSKRESMVLMPPSDPADSQSRRRSNRESAIYLPINEDAQHEEALNRRSKRESMLLPSPNRLSLFEAKDKRRAMADAIQIHLSAENSEAEYLSDDSFMEELQSAKFEEAKPISVSKSPISPGFPFRKGSVASINIPERSTSQQFSSGRLSPDSIRTRKSSGPWLPRASADTVVMAKKINVSSGISQRIRALAEKSTRDSSTSVSPAATPDASTSIVAQRKSSFFSSPPTGSPPNGPSVKRLSHASFANLSKSTKSDGKFVLQPPPSSAGPTVYNVQQSPKKPESVQVTARIVRDARTQKPTLTMPNGNTPLELHQSPIIIDHQKATQCASPKAEPTSPRPPWSSHSREPSSSAPPRTSSESGWRPFSRRMSESRPPPTSQSVYSIESTEEKKEEKKEKKDSRTSKLFKRMSSISSISRKNSINGSSFAEEEHQSTSLPSLREPPPAVQVGDLNVQFPDTLLWKRRWVEIDGTGNIVLSLSRANEQSKGITKRFHLSEFRMPYVPDQDRQELPNSVILDFLDGRTLQCACETYVAQMQVLQILREAHDAWLAYDQHQ